MSYFVNSKYAYQILLIIFMQYITIKANSLEMILKYKFRRRYKYSVTIKKHGRAVCITPVM